MNYQHLTVKELIRYLDLTSTDPLVRKLIQLLQDESLVEELAEAGMDPVTQEFKHDWEYFGPASYIEKLRNDVDYYVEECNNLENKVRELEGEVTRMSTVSLVNFIADVQHKLEMNKLETARANNRAEAERAARKEAEQKFEFWDKMNHGVK
jgi:hypothetical protein